MTETPGERLRRIVSAWRKQKPKKPSSTATPDPAGPSRSTQTTAANSGKTTQPAAQTSLSTHQLGVESTQPASKQPLAPATPSHIARTAPPPSGTSAQSTDQASPHAYQPSAEPVQRGPVPRPTPAGSSHSTQAAPPPSAKPFQSTEQGSPSPHQPSAKSAEPASKHPPAPARRAPASIDARLLSRLAPSSNDVEKPSVPPSQATKTTVPPAPVPETVSLEPAPTAGELKTPTEARQFLERLRAKTAQVVQDFSNGVISQRQFQAVYSHYQRQLIAVERSLIEMPGSDAWRAAAVEGHTSFLRQQHAAQVLSYAIYETGSGIPLAHVGGFKVDEALLVPMLSTFRSSTKELFGAGMKRIELEGGQSLCYVPGRYTTLIVVFSAEPAPTQLNTIEDSHRDFELVYQMNLSSGDVTQLAHTFTSLWAFEQGPDEP